MDLSPLSYTMVAIDSESIAVEVWRPKTVIFLNCQPKCMLWVLNESLH